MIFFLIEEGIISLSAINYLLCRSILTEVRPYDNIASDARDSLAKLLKTDIRRDFKLVLILACYFTLLFWHERLAGLISGPPH